MPDSVIKANNISSLSGDGVGFPDGSVSSPSLNFTNDRDTGLYRIGSNTIGIASGGNKVSEVQQLGILNGMLGTEFRNVVQCKTWITENTTPWLAHNFAQTTATNTYLMANQARITAKTTGGIILITGNIVIHASSGGGASVQCIGTLTYNSTGVSQGSPNSSIASLPGDAIEFQRTGFHASVAGSGNDSANNSICAILKNAYNDSTPSPIYTVAGTTYSIASWAQRTAGTIGNMSINANNAASNLILWELY